jgi:ferric-dicitrate binding protein FerR (iron transport regulator)
VKKLDKNITAVPQWKKSADEVWNDRFEALVNGSKLEGSDQRVSSQAEAEEAVPTDMVAKKIDIRKYITYILSSAAVLVVLFGAAAFLYKEDLNAQPGETRIVHLPDGTLAEISSGSNLSYRPLLWMVQPEVDMAGEVYFSGHHAKGFKVNTEHGCISVLGTSFNAKTYDGKLNVACIDGKVEVKDHLSSVILTDRMQTTLDDGRVTTSTISDTECVVGWTKGVFSFYDKPLLDVLKDVERYYNVKVSAPEGIDTLMYTGRFTREKTPEEVLAIIGQPYGITLKIIK